MSKLYTNNNVLLYNLAWKITICYATRALRRQISKSCWYNYADSLSAHNTLAYNSENL